jgi:hypothetical protein
MIQKEWVEKLGRLPDTTIPVDDEPEEVEEETEEEKKPDKKVPPRYYIGTISHMNKR